MWFASEPAKQRIWENILKFRTLTTHIRVWIDRESDGPQPDADWAEIQEFIGVHRHQIDGQTLQSTVTLLTEKFPRISAIEVLNGSGTSGVLLYPRWP